MRYVPTDEFAPVLRRLIGDVPTTVVAERAGVPFDTIDAILRQRRQGCDFNAADRLLCALGGHSLWWGELAHIYYAIDLGFYDKTYERREHVCRRGHVAMAKVGSRGNTYCTVCDREAARKYRQRQKELREEAA